MSGMAYRHICVRWVWVVAQPEARAKSSSLHASERSVTCQRPSARQVQTQLQEYPEAPISTAESRLQLQLPGPEHCRGGRCHFQGDQGWGCGALDAWDCPSLLGLSAGPPRRSHCRCPNALFLHKPFFRKTSHGRAHVTHVMHATQTMPHCIV